MSTPPETHQILPLFCFFFLFSFFHGAYSKTHWRDAQALRQLRTCLDPRSVLPGSCVGSWDFSLDPCDNLYGQKFTCGFSCDVVPGGGGVSRVTELALDQAGYSGTLSSTSWSFLSFLRSLDLSGNNFSGRIPDSFSNLTHLQRLSLSHNSLHGPIPDSLGSLSGLQELYLDNNALEGRVPASLGGLSSIRRLEIQGNRLSGDFPDLSGMRSLYLLDASHNAISGPLPQRFPASIVQISMRNNDLRGPIPAEIGTLGYLQVVDFSHNGLQGPVPASLFSHPSLQQLTLSNNRLSLLLPPGDLGTQSGLIAVDLSGNQLGGLLPGFMGLMPKLSSLSLENNGFVGLIPALYALKTVLPVPGVAPFERLLLRGNYLIEPIPGLFMGLKPGSVNVDLVDNCLFGCPSTLFFCQGGDQKSVEQCKNLAPLIP